MSRFASVTEIIKYVEKLLLFSCLVFSTTSCETVYKFQDELSFLPRAGVFVTVTKVDFQVVCLQVGGGRMISEVQGRVCYHWQRLFSALLSSSQVFVGGCSVLKLRKDYAPLVLDFLVLIRHPCVLMVSE